MGSLRLAAASLLIVVFGLGAWAAVYAYDKGFSKKWRRLIKEEFVRRGIEADIGKLTIDPVDGLVARDVKIYADSTHQSVTASINNITLDIDLAKLLRKEQFLNTIELRDADISLPIDPAEPEGELLEIKNFSARIHLPENKIEIEQAECEFHGVHVTLVGSLLQPRPDEGDEGKRLERLRMLKERRAVIANVVEELERFQLDPKRPPHLRLELIGDLDDPTSIEATAHLTGEGVARGKFISRSLEVRAEYHHPELLVDQIRITDEFGELYADARWRVGERAIPFNVESSIDAHAFIGSLFDTPTLGEVFFYQPPRLSASGHVDIATENEPAQLRLVGNFECDGFGSRGEVFEGAHADFSIDGGRWYVRNLLLEHRTGSARAKMLNDPGTGVTYWADIKMDPSIFIPFFEKRQTKDLLERFKIGKDSDVEVSFTGSGPSLDQLTWITDGEFEIEDCHLEEIFIADAKGTFHIQDRVMDIRDMTTVLDEGHVKGELSGELVTVRGEEQLIIIDGFTADLEGTGTIRGERITVSGRDMTIVARGVEGDIEGDDLQGGGKLEGDLITLDTEGQFCHVENVRGIVFPEQVTKHFSAKATALLSRYKFESPPKVRLDGKIDMVSGRFASDFTAKFEHDGPAAFQLFERQLPVVAPKGLVNLKGTTLEISVEADMLGGRAIYAGSSGIGPEKGNVHGRLHTSAIQFGELAKLYEIPTETLGTLSGNLDFKISAEDKARWSGKGSARLVQGNVFAIPVLGPISRLISGVMQDPTAGYSVAQQASATFVIDKGVIRSNDLEALTPGFTLRAEGKVDTVQKQIDIDAEMNARGPLRIVGWPISKLLKYKGEGPVSDPTWRPVNFSLPPREGEEPGVPGGMIGAVPKAIGAVPKATVGLGVGAIETGAKVIETGARGAVDLGWKARDLIPIPRLFFPKREEGEREGEEPAPDANQMQTPKETPRAPGSKKR